MFTLYTDSWVNLSFGANLIKLGEMINGASLLSSLL